MAILLVSLDNTSHSDIDAHSSHTMGCGTESYVRSTPLWIIGVSVPAHGLAAPSPTCCLHLIHNVAEDSSMFLKERLEKKETA